MLFWIIVVMVVCAACGLPWLPVVVVGALVMLLASYLVSRLASVKNLGIGYVMFATSTLVMRDLMSRSPDLFQVPTWAEWIYADSTLGVLSVIVVVMATFLGVFGPASKELRTDMEDVLAAVKRREDEQKGDK